MIPAIELINITKDFTVFYEAPALIKNILPFLKPPGSYEKLRALNNISFRLECGKCYAIIGRNGSGKSTLLQLIAGITQETSGTKIISGKISTLLELCSGFHPELTGKENIYLNGSLLGLSRKKLNEKFKEILEFSELDKFIDSKVKIYSSGMFMRLGFAIAIQADFDIFLCDEIIAVGDHAFRKKCYNRILDFKKEGKCIVFASHDPSAIELLADYAFWLDKGNIVYHGAPKETLEKYL